MRGVGVIMVMLVMSAAAHAQPGPAPALPTRSDDWTVDRHGIILLGGFDFVSGDRSQFAVVYVPIPLEAAPRFKLGVTGSLQYQQQVVFGGDDLVLWAYYLQPMPQYDWKLPIASTSGDFAIATEAGPGFGQIWAKLPTGPYMPPGWERVTFYTFSADVSFQFQAHNGLVVSVQPFGFSVPLNHPSAPDSRWTVSADAAYIFSLGAGYRWR